LKFELYKLFLISLIFVPFSYAYPTHASLKALDKVSLSAVPDNNTTTKQKANNVNSTPFTFVSPFSQNTSVSSSRTATLIDIHQSPQLPPIANAGANQVVTAGSTVILNGSNSRSPNGIILSYSWRQMPEGSSNNLNGVFTPVWEFAAPNVTADTLMRFQLNVTDNLGQIGTAYVNVLNKPHSVLGASPATVDSLPVIKTIPSSKPNALPSPVNIPTGHTTIHPPLTPPLSS
jgi:hypothetical protein